jgi:two-component system sensor histidine kinase GlrK
MNLSIRWARPRSFLSLLLIGFLATALPLVAAILLASLQVDRLARHSQDAVYRSVQLTHGARNLVDGLTGMERHVRQFLVLKDDSLLASYDGGHASFQGTVTYMLALQSGSDQSVALPQLAERERRLYAALRGQDLAGAEVDRAVAEFGDLAKLAEEILARANEGVGEQVEVMRQMAARSHRLLLWQGMAVVPLVVGMAIVFIPLIARPLRQLDDAVRRLGEGELYQGIAVGGPRDLEVLGQRLEWLRIRLLELDEEKRQFLRHVSHELKTPLTAVREGAELMAEQVVGPLNEQQLEVSRILHSNALRLQKLIEDLLAFSRLPEVRAAAGGRETVRLDSLIASVLADYRVSALAHGVRFRVTADPIALSGHRSRLRTLIDNLISNAVKYSPKGGLIDVQLREDAEGVCLEVRDRGPGIPPQDRQRVFDAFYQGRVQPSGPVRGTGLGLAIARECAVAHGGEIRIIDEESPGAHIRVTLPSSLVVSRGS